MKLLKIVGRIALAIVFLATFPLWGALLIFYVIGDIVYDAWEFGRKVS